jgi:structural maintenance of chromosome 3 (chondroitin sulfate proteoglycan 6)
VTVEGDRVDRKGALTGGFHDVKRSRLDMIKTLKKWREAFETDSARHKEVKDGLAKIDQSITKVAGEIQVLEAKRRQALDVRARFADQSQWTKKEEDQLRARLESLQSQLASAVAELKAAEVKRKADEAELKTPMTQTLTAAELASLATLSTALEGQKKALVDTSLARAKAASEKSKLDIELSENLRRKREELRGKVDQVEGDAGAGMQASEVAGKEAELKGLARSIEDLAAQVKGELYRQPRLASRSS